jgi:hypothetical protein
LFMDIPYVGCEKRCTKTFLRFRPIRKQAQSPETPQ